MERRIEEETKEAQKQELITESNNLLQESKELMIFEDNKFILKDSNQQQIAGILLREATELEKKIKAHYKPMEDANKATGKKIREAKQEQLAGPQEAKKILSQGMGNFNEKLRREAAEKVRIEQERIEEERIKEAAKKIQEAEKLKEKGTPESMTAAINLETEAEDILDLPDPIVEVKQPEKISGTKQQRFVKVDIIDEYQLRMFLLKRLQEGALLDEIAFFLKSNESEIRKYLKHNDGKMEWPGTKVRIEYKTSTTGR